MSIYVLLNFVYSFYGLNFLPTYYYNQLRENTNFKAVAYGDSMDWKDYGTDQIIKTVVENEQLENGSIVLMHNGAKYITEALDGVINGLEEKGYEIVPISELIYTGDCKVDQMGRQHKK